MRHLYTFSAQKLGGLQIPEPEASTKQSQAKQPVLVQLSEDRYRWATFIAFVLMGLVPPQRNKMSHENGCLENPAFPSICLTGGGTHQYDFLIQGYRVYRQEKVNWFFFNRASSDMRVNSNLPTDPEPAFPIILFLKSSCRITDILQVLESVLTLTR